MNEENKNSRTDSIKQQEIELIREISPEILEALKKIPGGNAGLIVLKGPIPGEKFIIKKSVFSIGRSPESDILLDDITVSRQHAVIEKSGQDYILKDLGSLNGTYLNGEIINEAALSHSDKIQIGKYIFIFFCL